MQDARRVFDKDLSMVITGKHLFVITHAASSYHKVLEENRKLYNQVQDLKGSPSSKDLVFHVIKS